MPRSRSTNHLWCAWLNESDGGDGPWRTTRGTSARKGPCRGTSSGTHHDRKAICCDRQQSQALAAFLLWARRPIVHRMGDRSAAFYILNGSWGGLATGAVEGRWDGSADTPVNRVQAGACATGLIASLVSSVCRSDPAEEPPAEAGGSSGSWRLSDARFHRSPTGLRLSAFSWRRLLLVFRRAKAPRTFPARFWAWRSVGVFGWSCLVLPAVPVRVSPLRGHWR